MINRSLYLVDRNTNGVFCEVHLRRKSKGTHIQAVLPLNEPDESILDNAHNFLAAALVMCQNMKFKPEVIEDEIKQVLDRVQDELRRVTED